MKKLFRNAFNHAWPIIKTLSPRDKIELSALGAIYSSIIYISLMDPFESRKNFMEDYHDRFRLMRRNEIEEAKKIDTLNGNTAEMDKINREYRRYLHLHLHGPDGPPD